ncbi:Telomerase Cajal body protein 1 [Gaertneriomyces sp. JEL0708]|nr:Telomerase Cajal body protein 1 [Gaertneriomyces sp. JEL0708]
MEVCEAITVESVSQHAAEVEGPFGEDAVQNDGDMNAPQSDPIDPTGHEAQPHPVYSYPYSFVEVAVELASTGRTLCTNAVSIRVAATAARDFEVNFCKGIKWSPDGSCILSSTSDNILRMFEKPAEVVDFSTTASSSLSPVLTIDKAETVYDFCWYPFMTSLDPSTCCFLSSSKDHPVHMWDAYTGQMRCSYAAFDHLDQVYAPNALTFNLFGTKIYCGFNNLVQVFDVHRPGRDSLRIPTTPSKKSRDGQKGLVSTIAFNPDASGLYAVGSYSKTVGLYDERNDELLQLLRIEEGSGVTQATFSVDGVYLYTASRKSNQIECWDIRNTGDILATYARAGDTNQRISFHLDPSGRYLITGDQHGDLSTYDVKTNQLVQNFRAHNDTVSAASFHPTLPLVASCSGQRRDTMRATPMYAEDGTVSSIYDEDLDMTYDIDCSVKIWGLPWSYSEIDPSSANEVQVA